MNIAIDISCILSHWRTSPYMYVAVCEKESLVVKHDIHTRNVPALRAWKHVCLTGRLCKCHSMIKGGSIHSTWPRATRQVCAPRQVPAPFCCRLRTVGCSVFQLLAYRISSAFLSCSLASTSSRFNSLQWVRSNP